MDTFRIVDAPGFGIATAEFLIEDGFDIEDADPAHMTRLHQIVLVQSALLDEVLLEVAGLSTLHLTVWVDVVQEELWPLLQEDLVTVRFQLDGTTTTGAVLNYRDITFLFSGRPWTTPQDFTVWRLPAADPSAPWPEVKTTVV